MFDRLLRVRQGLLHFSRLDKGNVLFGEIHPGFHVRQDPDESFPECFDFFGERPAQQGLGGLQAPRGRGLNRIEHRFGLGEVQPAVEKRPLGKLSGLRHSGAVLDQAVAGGLQDPGSAVGLDFHHVFASIRMRLAHDDDQGFVYGWDLGFILPPHPGPLPPRGEGRGTDRVSRIQDVA